MINQSKISEDVISTLIELTKNIIGEKAVNLVLNHLKLEGKEQSSSGEYLVFAFADEIQKMFGKQGGYAITRQLGREVAKVLQEKYPKEEWEEVLATALSVFGFAQKVSRNENEAYIQDCVFYPILKEKGHKPIEHCVCWTGWGFIESFVSKLEEGVKGIKWVERDVPNKKCKFIYIKG